MRKAGLCRKLLWLTHLVPVHDLQMCNAVAAVPAAWCCCLFPAWSRGIGWEARIVKQILTTCSEACGTIAWPLQDISRRKRSNLKESASEPCLLLCCPGPQQDCCVPSRYSSYATKRSQPYLQHLQQMSLSVVDGSCWFTFWKLGKIWNGSQKASVIFKA